LANLWIHATNRASHLRQLWIIFYHNL
jgi:hypothetical protein